MEERNINELINICIEYFNKNNTPSGLNLKLTKDEINKLLEYTNTSKLAECVHILVYGYVGICKICGKRTGYINKTKLYRKYCCHHCSTIDKDAHLKSTKKGIETKKRNNKKRNMRKIIKTCKECGCDVEIAYIKRNTFLGYCDKHKKICEHCGKRHNNAGRCCSTPCTNELKKITNLKNAGVEHNLLRYGVKKNQIEYYIKRGYTYDESINLISKFQKDNNIVSNTTDNKLKNIFTKYNVNNIDEYFLLLLNKIKDYKYKELYKPYKLIRINSSPVIFEKYSIKYIYNKLYKLDNDIFNYERIKFKRYNYGYISYTKDDQILRSKLEYDFYRLLETNDIKNYKIGKLYPNSKYYYDFYLVDYNIYVEIAGMMSIKKYALKMEFKKNYFENVDILENKNDMLLFIEKIKNLNEN